MVFPKHVQDAQTFVLNKVLTSNIILSRAYTTFGIHHFGGVSIRKFTSSSLDENTQYYYKLS